MYTKYIVLRYFYIREKIISRKIEIQKVNIMNNLTNYLTKELLKSRFQKLIKKMKMKNGLKVQNFKVFELKKMLNKEFKFFLNENNNNIVFN